MYLSSNNTYITMSFIVTNIKWKKIMNSCTLHGKQSITYKFNTGSDIIRKNA